MHREMMSTRPISFVLFVFFCVISPSLAVRRIACPSPVYEFGSMDNSRSVERDFEISNEGDETLRIGRIRGDRGQASNIENDPPVGWPCISGGCLAIFDI